MHLSGQPPLHGRARVFALRFKRKGVANANAGTSDGGSHDSQPETASRAAPAPAPPPAARTQEELQQLAAEDEQAGKDMIMTKFEEGLREGEGERGPDVDASLPESGSRGGGDGNPGVALMEKTPLGESRITHTPGLSLLINVLST
jgi:hypothetical protein